MRYLLDINAMRPVFRNDHIAGYTMSITHLPDIGGLGFDAAATEIFHEGLRLPICKLVRAGRLDEPMLDVIRSNVRVPEQVFGDLMANITCNEVGARQLLEFMVDSPTRWRTVPPATHSEYNPSWSDHFGT